MTIKTLSFIHDLLVNEEHSAALKLKWYHESDYSPAIDMYKEKSMTKARYEEIKAKHDELYEKHERALDALIEFEAKEW